MRILCFTLLLFVSGLQAFGQHTVRGRITDEESGEAVAGATVRVVGGMNGCITDGQGRFELKVKGSRVRLEISRLSYERTYREIGLPLQRPLQIRLKPADIEIGEVHIRAGLEQVLKDPTLHIFDFAFDHENLFVIIYDKEKRRNMLALVNERDSILDYEAGPESPASLYRDCLGNVHALSEHYACQLFAEEGKIGLFVDPIDTFKTYVEPCLESDAGHYYYRQYAFNNQILTYYDYDAENQEWDDFFEVKDKDKMHRLMDPFSIYRQIAPTEEAMMAITPEQWKQVAHLDKEFQFQQLACFYPVYAPLFAMAGEVWIFDHLEHKVRRFDPEGKKLSEADLSYDKDRRWKREIIPDRSRGEAWVVLRKHGFASLARINPETGQLGQETEIPRQFPEKIVIRDRQAYFMYKDHHYDPTNRLYRLPL